MMVLSRPATEASLSTNRKFQPHHCSILFSPTVQSVSQSVSEYSEFRVLFLFQYNFCWADSQAWLSGPSLLSLIRAGQQSQQSQQSQQRQHSQLDI